MTLQALKCLSCGSSDLEDTAWNTTRCQHCGTVSRVSEDRLRVEILVWACPRCGFNNEREVRFCARCGQPLLGKCPICGTETRSAAQFCENCGVNLGQEGLLIGTWVDNIKRQLPRYGASPSMRATAVEGPFADVLQTCATVLAELNISLMLAPTRGFKDIKTDPQAAMITAKLGSG